MSLFVKWDQGVAVEYKGGRVIFDPQVSNPMYQRVFITHAHGDHAKGFTFSNHSKFSTRGTLDLTLALRGKPINNLRLLSYKDAVGLNQFDVKAYDAGHILGSCIYEVTTPEGNLVYTGDFNFTEAFTMKPATAVNCDTLVIEATFGSPSFIFPSRRTVAAQIIAWVANSLRGGKVPVFQTDSVGNAQELITLFNTLTGIPVVTDPKVSRANRVYEAHGFSLSYVDANALEASELLAAKQCVFITPKNFNHFENKVSEPNLAFVSGMALRLGGSMQPFLLSDHADFPHLLAYVEAVKPKRVFTYHGAGVFNEILAKTVEKKLGVKASPLF